MPALVHKHPRIITKNADGEANGWLLPIFNINDGIISPEQFPNQVYLTVVSPKEVKGPHLHFKRWGLFTCVRGDVRIITRHNGKYEEHFSGEHFEFATVQVPAGTPAALQNIGDDEAYVLNMPSPAWRVDDQDENSVAFDDYDFSWPRSR